MSNRNVKSHIDSIFICFTGMGKGERGGGKPFVSSSLTSSSSIVIFCHPVCTASRFSTLGRDPALRRSPRGETTSRTPSIAPRCSARGAIHSQEPCTMIHRSSREINLAGDARTLAERADTAARIIETCVYKDGIT